MFENSLKLPNLDLTQPIDKPILSSLYEVCKEWGFFYVTNSSISKHLIAEVCAVSKQIFSLPLESKLKLGPSSCLRTYTPHFIASPYFESLRVSGPDFFASANSSSAELFGQQNSHFSKVLEEFGNKMMELSKRIIEALLMSMGEDYAKKFNQSEFNKCHGYMRIVNYTPPTSLEELKQVEGLGMHTDMSCITILYQDQNGGLQMRSKQGEWIDINPCENSFVVNIGDLMQAWSNGKLRSSEHRVILKRPTNRFSLAFFWCFEDDKVVFAPEEIVGEDKLRAYKPFVCLDYLKFRENNEEGKFEKIGFTVNDFAGLRELQTADQQQYERTDSDSLKEHGNHN